VGVIVDPLGKNLPAGKGTAKEGAELYAKQCTACHGKTGEGGVADRLVMGNPGNPHRGMYTDQDRHPVGFWAYATTVWDYINRSTVRLSFLDDNLTDDVPGRLDKSIQRRFEQSFDIAMGAILRSILFRHRWTEAIGLDSFRAKLCHIRKIG